MRTTESRFCLRCGEEQSDEHMECLTALALEPPRFCGSCGRKLRVQVLPDGFRADCAVHGDVTASS